MRVVSLTLVILLVGCTGQDQSTDPSEGSSGQHRTVSGSPVCPHCEIVLEEIALLGSPSDPFSVREDAAGVECVVGRLTTGEYVVSAPVGGGELHVFDNRGVHERTIGRRGDGPGEFGTSIRLVVGPGDTLFIMDDSHRRVQVLSSSGEYLRSFSYQGQFRSFALLANGDLLFHRTPFTPADSLFYLMNSSGTVLARFGAVTMDEVDLDFWVVSPGGTGGFWTASIWDYRLFQWSGPGSLVRVLNREVDWFPEYGGFPDGTYETVPPPPFLQHMWEDLKGRLWTYSLIPDPAWEPGLGRRPNPEWYRRTFDTIIEVIDPKTGSLLAQHRFETRLGRVCGESLMYSVVEDDDGHTRIRIVEPTLVGIEGGIP